MPSDGCSGRIHHVQQRFALEQMGMHATNDETCAIAQATTQAQVAQQHD